MTDDLREMATNILIDEQLLEEARRVGGHRTNCEAVAEALREYIHRRQANIIELFGTIEFDPTYHHKKQRRRS
jgi:Arc/MetJ family transcription regulator